MSIKLAVTGRPTIDVDVDTISLGSDPHCTICFERVAGVKPKHAVIRKIAGRWLIEVREGDAIFVGGPKPQRLHWLNPGDVIRLVENAAEIVFQPSGDTPPSAPAVSQQAPLSDPLVKTSLYSPVPVNPGPILPLDLPPLRPPSSAAIPTSKPTLSATDRSTPADSHKTVPQAHPAINSHAPDEAVNAAKLAAIYDDESVPGVSAQQQPTVQPALRDLSADGAELSEEQTEMMWVMKLVGLAVLAGVVFVLFWLVATGISKIFAPTPIGPPAIILWSDW